ncbi:MAG TPA: cupredoxin family protein [Ramlibacter sp.]|nr:cupredoxin family protein [Ramlibacter sp.]
MHIARIAVVALLLNLPLLAWSHADGHRGAAPAVVKEQKPWGIAGERSTASRTIEVRMTDDMRFTPDRIEVRQRETIHFVVRNAGKVLHEMVIGTPRELRRHAVMMKKHPNMEHDDPYGTHVAAARTGEIVWKFNRAGSFQFACLIPGHFDAGMVGTIVVTPRKDR